jgi:hypothetical protein
MHACQDTCSSLPTLSEASSSVDVTDSCDSSASCTHIHIHAYAYQQACKKVVL